MDDTDYFARLVVGRETSEHVAITLFPPSEPLPTDPYERWLSVGIDIEVGAFSASYSGSFLFGDLERFHEQLETLNETLKGEATLAPMEPWLTLQIVSNGRGNLAVTGEASDDFTRNKLKFTLPDLDQTDLKPMVRNLEKILQNLQTREHR